MPELVVRPMGGADWPAVRAIYEADIATGNATFETEAPSWERWDAGHLSDQRYVAERDEAVVGWAAAGFRIVGTRERIGRMDGRWRDVVFLERRSSSAGTD